MTKIDYNRAATMAIRAAADWQRADGIGGAERDIYLNNADEYLAMSAAAAGYELRWVGPPAPAVTMVSEDDRQ